MRKPALFQLILFLFVASLAASAATPFQATTTLAAETGNNTSAASSFTTQTNGNIAPGNVSKVPVRTLLYPGSTAKIYTQFLPWFGFGDHMNVGYTSTDTLEIQKQVSDMVSRGLDGAIIDWYGTGASNSHFVAYDQAAQGLMHQAEQHPGFTFAIQHDGVALKNCGCNVTQTLISDLNYAVRTYVGSPAYLHYNGRPVFFFFGQEAYSIDWNLVRSSVSGNPLFIFRNTVGFSDAQNDGAFSWVEPTTSGFTYLDNYYATALTFPAKYSIGSAYKGFNDSLAAWGTNRLITQQCGQTFLQSITEAGKYYSTANQMLGIQLVTWNDYEEGTELETGIDNCVGVTASASGTVVSWSISGQMNTIDHFSVFVSQDGQNLMWLADENASVTSLDLAQFGLPAGNYSAYVKAVAKPMMTNKMSGPVALALAGAAPTASSFTISAPNGSANTIRAGQTANFALQLAASGGPFSVSISCTGAPANASCIGPSSAVMVNPGTPDPVNVSVSTVAHSAALPGFRLHAPPPVMWLLVLLAPAGLLLQKLLNSTRRTQRVLARISHHRDTEARRRGEIGTSDHRTIGSSVPFLKILGFRSPNHPITGSPDSPCLRGEKLRLKPVFASATPLVLVAALAVGCGGKSSASSGAPAPTPTPAPTPSAGGTPTGTYTLLVTATSGNVTHTEPLTLTVQ